MTQLNAASRLLVTIQQVHDAKNEGQHQDILHKTGYWGKRGAGCIIMAEDTKRFLFPLRSQDVQEPGTWGSWGGAVDAGEDNATSVRRELMEEAGYNGRIVALRPLLLFRDAEAGFQYQNYLAVVPTEFKPVLNWETDRAEWLPLDRLPRPLHPGLKALFKDARSMKTIQHFIKQ